MPSEDAALRSIDVSLGHDTTYPIRFGPLARLPTALREAGLASARCLLITDTHVDARYGDRVHADLDRVGWAVRRLVLPPGEATKSTDALGRIYDDALTWGVDRQSVVVALGGGVVGDLAGFAAATLLRGLPLVQCPTSLVAQVDSAIGGKTGINHATGKNLIGAFHQPRLVYADLQTLQTLPEREWTSGLAEVFKHALIASPALLEMLENRMGRVLKRSPEVIETFLPEAVRVKVDVVQDDVREQGRRAILNFGHTFGHALERCAGYGAFTHGEAVAVGMRAATWLSNHRHGGAVPLGRIDRLLRRLPLPAVPPDVTLEDLLEAMRADKKNRGGRIGFVLLRGVGEAYLARDLDRAELEGAWKHAKGE